MDEDLGPERDGYCPVCGFRTLPRYPRYNRFEVCPICYWEDDGIGEQPEMVNSVSVREARRNFSACGAFHPKFANQTRDPTADDERDDEWPYNKSE